MMNILLTFFECCHTGQYFLYLETNATVRICRHNYFCTLNALYFLYWELFGDILTCVNPTINPGLSALSPSSATTNRTMCSCRPQLGCCTSIQRYCFRLLGRIRRGCAANSRIRTSSTSSTISLSANWSASSSSGGPGQWPRTLSAISAPQVPLAPAETARRRK